MSCVLKGTPLIGPLVMDNEYCMCSCSYLDIIFTTKLNYVICRVMYIAELVHLISQGLLNS